MGHWSSLTSQPRQLESLVGPCLKNVQATKQITIGSLIAIVLGYSSSLDGKNLWVKMLHILVTRHREIDSVLTKMVPMC